MKRRDIIKKLQRAGFELKEGGNHTKIYKDGQYISAISRQNEINENIVRQIEKQTRIRLK